MGLPHLTPNIHLPVMSVTSGSLPADVPSPSFLLLCSYSTHSMCTINCEPFLSRWRNEHTHSRLSFVAVRTFCSRLKAGRRRGLGGCPADNAWASSFQQGVGDGGRGTGQLQTVTSAFRDSLSVREFLNIAILSSKLVEMATTNEQDRKKATGLQLALETRKSAIFSTIRNRGGFTDKQTAASRPREAGGSPHPRGGRGPQHRRGGNRGVTGCW